MSSREAIISRRIDIYRIDDQVATLARMSSSPYAPEPPRASFIVSLIMHMARFMKRTAHVTPHLSGSDDIAKVQYEYNEANVFFDSLKGFLDNSMLDGKDVLDAGCGWGGKMIYYAETTALKTISGFDLPGIYRPEVSEKFAKGKGVLNCSFGTGYAEEMPYQGAQFDLILMEDVLEHVRGPARVIHECSRLLRTGGTVIIKFPSIKMMYAHHLDRAITLPGLHYLLSFKTWAAGLNFLLINQGDKFRYEPFSEVVSTRFHKAVTRDLNGIDFEQFSRLTRESDFDTVVCDIVSHVTGATRRSALVSLYNALFRLAPLREFLGAYILFIGRKRT